jgi:phosphatidylserine/phosphatidylglycerophosphate/cardiolipin synthase-like enzyme
MTGLLALTGTELAAVSGALRSGRLGVPVSASALGRYLPASRAIAAAESLGRMSGDGAALADAMELLRLSREGQRTIERAAQLVTTGPSTRDQENRDTQIVVQDLLRRARHSVVISGYKFYNGREMFDVLGTKLRDVPGFRVQMFVDVQRTKNWVTDEAALAGFRGSFVRFQWPEGMPLPEVYYDPRSLGAEPEAVLHAKCVIVDGQILFISSANFTDSAQMKNVELGVVLQSEELAGQAERFFDGLVGMGYCVGLFGRV